MGEKKIKRGNKANKINHKKETKKDKVTTLFKKNTTNVQVYDFAWEFFTKKPKKLN